MHLTIRSLVLWGYLAPAAALATPFSTSVNVTTRGNPVNIDGTIVTPTCDLAQAGSATLGLNCSTELNKANALVGPGYMQVSAFSTVLTGESGHSVGTARAQASFTDSLSFFSTALAGQVVELKGSVVFHGVLSAGVAASFGGANASWAGYGGALGVGLVNQGIKQDYAGGAVPAPDMNTRGFLFPIVASLQFDANGHADSSLALTLIVEAQSSVSGLGSATAGADFGHTVYWSGISSLSVNGAAYLGDYTVNSASGADYRFSTSPVPEPATLATLLAGLAGLGCLMKRRRV